MGDEDEEEEIDPRKALYLDEQRFQPFLLVFLAVITNAMGENVIARNRKLDPTIINGNHFYFYFFNYFYLLCFGLFFIPATYMIEMKGMKQSIFFGMVMTTFAVWLNVWELETVASILIGVGMPFIELTITKLSATWFGPKGRNITSTFLIIGFLIPQTIDEFLE